MNTFSKVGLQMLTVIVFLGCSNIEKQEKSLPETKSVEIELSIPHGDYQRTLYVGDTNEPISVIFRNHTDSAVRMYKDWNSWGYFNISFEITTKDSIYIVRKKQKGWWKNFPSYNVIDPGESLVFNFNLGSSDPDLAGQRRIIRDGYNGWTGLPYKDYDSAKIRVLYELKEDISSVMFGSPVVKDEAIKRSFPLKLSSRQYDIAVHIASDSFNYIIDLDTSGSKKASK